MADADSRRNRNHSRNLGCCVYLSDDDMVLAEESRLGDAAVVGGDLSKEKGYFCPFCAVFGRVFVLSSDLILGIRLETVKDLDWLESLRNLLERVKKVVVDIVEHDLIRNS